jgi:hypothetical protein
MRAARIGTPGLPPRFSGGMTGAVTIHSRSVTSLGGVDEFEPVLGSGDVNHAHEGFGELVVPRGDRALIFNRPNMRSIPLRCL